MKRGTIGKGNRTNHTHGKGGRPNWQETVDKAWARRGKAQRRRSA